MFPPPKRSWNTQWGLHMLSFVAETGRGQSEEKINQRWKQRRPQIRTNVFLRTLVDHAREESETLTVTPQTDGREDVGCALAIKGYPRPSPHLRPSALHCSFTFLISGGLGHQRDVPADCKSFLKCLRCSV